MVQTEENIVQWAKGRDVIYTYLADCYLNIPSKEIVETAPQFEQIFNSLAQTAGDTMQEGSELFSKFIMHADKAIQVGDVSELLEKINMEYTALFMMGGTSTPFFESAFLGKTDTQKNEIRMDVYHYFASHQFERRGSLNIPEDALCHELDYMAKMSTLMTVAEDQDVLNSLIKEQCAFMDSHLTKWIGVFEDSVKSSAEVDDSLFFTAITTITKAFVLFDYQLLMSLVEDV